MPAAGWVWAALGLWRGVMEVSVVGIGSVSLATKGSVLAFSVITANGAGIII